LAVLNDRARGAPYYRVAETGNKLAVSRGPHAAMAFADALGPSIDHRETRTRKGEIMKLRAPEPAFAVAPKRQTGRIISMF
jgi:hypothetical protein